MKTPLKSFELPLFEKSWVENYDQKPISKIFTDDLFWPCFGYDRSFLSLDLSRIFDWSEHLFNSLSLSDYSLAQKIIKE